MGFQPGYGCLAPSCDGQSWWVVFKLVVQSIQCRIGSIGCYDLCFFAAFDWFTAGESFSLWIFGIWINFGRRRRSRGDRHCLIARLWSYFHYLGCCDGGYFGWSVRGVSLQQQPISQTCQLLWKYLWDHTYFIFCLFGIWRGQWYRYEFLELTLVILCGNSLPLYDRDSIGEFNISKLQVILSGSRCNFYRVLLPKYCNWDKCCGYHV
mmetsp:Transcript_19563/g.40246  ORF Transcript_19563/g.40246 Transcript_19563/m.40246 type:complete len:208 (+) Transcript_19563:248-871(+)